jgi:hypothetical protein
MQKIFFYQSNAASPTNKNDPKDDSSSERDKNKHHYELPQKCTKSRFTSIDANFQMNPIKYKQLQDSVGRDIDIPNLEMFDHLHMT